MHPMTGYNLHHDQLPELHPIHYGTRPGERVARAGRARARERRAAASVDGCGNGEHAAHEKMFDATTVLFACISLSHRVAGLGALANPNARGLSSCDTRCCVAGVARAAEGVQ